jgi:WD40 repeat protein
VPRDEPQYLAVGGSRDSAKNYVINQREYNEKGSIQLWRFAPGVLQNVAPDAPLPLPVLDLVILHEHGCAWDMKWFPGNTFDSLGSGWSSTAADRRLGVLSVAFNDGTFAVYSVPHPLALRALAEAARSSSSSEEGEQTLPPLTNEPVYIRLPAIYEVQLEEDVFTRIAWSPAHPHRRVAVGTSRGGVMIWDTMEIVQAIRTQQAVDPVYCFVAHENYVRGLDWCSKDRDFLGSVLVSTGYDGRVCILDLRDFMSPSVLSRARGFVTDVLWRPQFDGMLWTNPDNLIRYASNADLRKSNAVIQHQAIVWGIDASDYHLFIASASADGTLLITNPLRSRNRKFKNLHVPLYKTNFQPTTASSTSDNVVQFLEDLRPEERVPVPVQPELLEPDNWVCCVRWHPLASASTWLASGLRNGLVRVESAGSDGQTYGGRQAVSLH